MSITNNQEIVNKLYKTGRVPNNVLYLCYRGSISHNTILLSTDQSSTNDVDLLGVFIAPKEYYLGISYNRNNYPTTIEIKEEVDGVLLDCVFYEIQHFTSLALRNNPNIFCALWVNTTHRLLFTDMFRPYIFFKRLFLSRYQIFKSFTGYANNQLYKMEHYTTEGYMGEKRKRLIEKYGYDTKNAAQLVLLLHIGIESLNTQRISPFRSEDAELIKNIKRGLWELDEVKIYAANLFKLSHDAYETSKMQDQPKISEVESILMGILEEFIIKNKIF